MSIIFFLRVRERSAHAKEEDNARASSVHRRRPNEHGSRINSSTERNKINIVFILIFLKKQQKKNKNNNKQRSSKSAVDDDGHTTTEWSTRCRECPLRDAAGFTSVCNDPTFSIRRHRVDCTMRNTKSRATRPTYNFFSIRFGVFFSPVFTIVTY